MAERFNAMSDEALAALSQKGDSDAEEALIRRYMNFIRSKARIYFIAGADSEDVIQEGMIGLYRAIRSYSTEEKASFHTYADLCINRQIITAIRTAARLKHEPLNNSISLNMTVGDDEVTLGESLADARSKEPEAEFAIKDISAIISDNADKIFSKMEFEVLKMFMEGMSHAEICNAMHKDYKSIDNALQRIKKKINGYIFG